MKVLLTRRRADSERTAKRLAEAGIVSLIAPLFKLVETSKEPPISEPEFLVATSAAVFETGAIRDLVDRYAELPLYCVGPRTAEAAANIGYKNIRQADGNAESLALMIKRDYSPATAATSVNGWYLCGSNRAYDLVGALADGSIELHLWEVYEYAFCDDAVERIEAEIYAGKPLIIMLYSARSAEKFFFGVNRQILERSLDNVHFVAISKACAAKIPVGFSHKTQIARSPDEDGMILAARRLANHIS